jgi:hypothetical protein
MENETGAAYQKEHIVLPSDIEEQEAKKKGLNYVRIRSGKAKVYDLEAIQAFELTHPGHYISYELWYAERKWNQLIHSKGCQTRGDFK